MTLYRRGATNAEALAAAMDNLVRGDERWLNDR
jgi:hypothetical protein